MKSLFPQYDGQGVVSGELVKLSKFCEKKIAESEKCLDFYRSLHSCSPGWHQCPYGLSCRSFYQSGSLRAFTGVVAFPRFDTDAERRVAKAHPELRIARTAIDSVVDFIQEVDGARADAVAESSKVLPQAFHELRKLNGIVLQVSEKEISDNGESRSLLNIKGAAELMRNNFDILEALSNLDVMKALPLDSTVNLYDLAFKMKRLYQEVAAKRDIGIRINGVRAVIGGSQKSFPIVPAVLLENAIKYGVNGTVIQVDIEAEDEVASLTVRNATRENVDPVRCFERGVRCSNATEGGGFGLYLAKEIVAAHGGQIICERGDGVVAMKVHLPLRTVIAMR